MTRFFTLCLICCVAAAASAQESPADDGRIRTFVYDHDRVYAVVTEAGYQSNIEFERGEEIETLSVGDRIGWQIVPAGRRLFLRALQNGIHTNMTVITSKRTYQFDLSSVTPGKKHRDVIYVVRFDYPSAGASPVMPAAPPLRLPAAAPPPVEMPADLHYDYTYTGPDASAPLKIFDDGRRTYFKFRGDGSAPAASLVRPDGTEAPLSMTRTGEYFAAPVVAARFTLRLGGDVICVFNESFPQAAR